MCLTELYEAPTPQVPSNPVAAQEPRGRFQGDGDIKTNESGQRLDWFRAGVSFRRGVLAWNSRCGVFIQRFNLHDDDYHESIAQDAACARAFL